MADGSAGQVDETSLSLQYLHYVSEVQSYDL